MTGTDPSASHGKPLCNARRKRQQGLCKRPAGWGTPNPGIGPCKLHGGCVPNVVKSVGVRRLDAAARDAVRELVIEDVTDPLTALARHAGEIIAVRDFLRGEVNRLEALRYQSGAGEQLRAELAAYQSALRDTTQVLGVYAKLRIDERLARISQAQADMLVRAFDLAMNAAGLRDQEQRLALRVAMAKELRTLSADDERAPALPAGEWR